MSKNYAGVEDILCDDAFLAWYFKTDIRAARRWEKWITENPGSSPTVQQAMELLESLALKERNPHPELVTHAQQRLLDNIRPTLHTGIKWWMAAACILALTTGIYLLIPKNDAPAFHTNFGEITASRLPDGTEVTINADSRITWSGEWKDGKDREVWLTGEAFFHVRKTPLKSRFIVHTGHFNVIVTGTMFNVLNRQDKSNVMLQEGSVTLQTADGEELAMTPGDFVEYSHDRLVKRTVKQDSVIAWKEHKLSFNNTPVTEVATIIQQQYGVTTRLANDSVAKKTVSGIMPNNNLEVLLNAMELTSDFKVVRQGGEIIIQDHSN